MGTMQYAALSDPTLDKHWEFWNGISKKLSNDLGFECFCEPVEEITIGEKNHKMSIQEYVAENWESLPKSTFNGDELVIVSEIKNEDWGYGNHSYSGVGVNKEGKLFWTYSSGCSCNGSCGMDHKSDFKVLEVQEGFKLPTENFEKIDFSWMQVDFSDY